MWRLLTASLLFLAVFTTAQPVSAVESKYFLSARPVWPAGLEKEKNLTVGFRAIFPSPTDGAAPILRITGSTIYRIYLNGTFVGHGPARGPQGFFRVDEIPLAAELLKKTNVLAVEVAGYNVNSYYLLDQPSFLQAEVTMNGRVLAATGGKVNPFAAKIVTERVKKVQRYSFQRPFIEYYRLKEGYDAWRADPGAPFVSAKCAVLADKKLIPRRVALSEFLLRQPVRVVSTGGVEKIAAPSNPWKDRSLTDIGPKLGGYPEKELEITPSIELQSIRFVSPLPDGEAYVPGKSARMTANSFRLYDYGTNLTGFLGAEVKCSAKTRLYVTFDELLADGDVDFKRMGSVNAVGYDLEPGRYALETFEPYTCRYLKILVLEGDCTVERVYLREYVNPEAGRASFACSDPRLNRVFEAARETFRQNAVDIFMDCPSRERAGWLCDSFFTARTAFDLTGDTSIEKNFLENFLLPEKFEHLPAGMLPMCYPSDHNDGVFIPNWALWFVVELEEYQARSGDRALVQALKPRVLALFDYFKPFRNSDGLLEKLNSWVFVEWSKANDFVQDVNYPSNMLYATALSAAADMYAMPELANQAESVRAAVRKQSLTGTFFSDNAVRENTILKVTKNTTEACQYYAFFFDCASPKGEGELWNTLMKSFGPTRDAAKVFPDVFQANAFIGNYLRIELLSREGMCRQLRDEIADFFVYMADRTGTLWENTHALASCDHGFASHAAHTLLRDMLGIYRVDAPGKKVTLRFANTGLDWCEGKIPVKNGYISVSWHKDGDRVIYRANVPEGWKLEVENPYALKLERQ